LIVTLQKVNTSEDKCNTSEAVAYHRKYDTISRFGTSVNPAKAEASRFDPIMASGGKLAEE
jgi:hypothetical protein